MVPIPGNEDPKPLADLHLITTRTQRDLWSAGCVERRTSGAGSGPGKPAGGNTDRAPRADFHYNTRRIQKNLGWRSPDEFETAWAAGELTATDLQRLATDAARRRSRRAERTSRPTPVAPDTGQMPGQRPTPTAKRVRPSGRTRTQQQNTRSTA